MKVTLRIPVVLDRKGAANGWITQDANGEHSEDVGLLYDNWSEEEAPDDDLRLVYVTVEVDLEQVFRQNDIPGKVDLGETK